MDLDETYWMSERDYNFRKMCQNAAENRIGADLRREEERRQKALIAIKKANPNTNPIGLGISFERLIPPTDPAFRASRPRISLKGAFRELWKQLTE